MTTPTTGHCRILAASAAWDRMATAASARDGSAFQAAHQQFERLIGEQLRNERINGCAENEHGRY